MDYEEEKERILSALDEGDYSVLYEPTDGIEEREKWDGTKFYVFLEDDVKYGIDGGRCIIDVAGHSFRYDIMCDEWLEGETEDEDENDLINELIEDEEVDEALRDADGFVDCDDYDADKQFEIYVEANGIDPAAERYSVEDEDLPKDINSFNYTEVSVPLRYGVEPKLSGEFQSMTCVMNEMELYGLAKYLIESKGKEAVEKGISLGDEEIKKQFPKLYGKISRQVLRHLEENGTTDCSHFYLMLNREIFEGNLE